MKANEVPKSKFVYPNKLYARTNNNITLDISYAPQTLEAVEYTRTDAFIEKAENFLEMLGYGFIITDNITHTNYDKEQLIEDFRNYMGGE